MRSILNFIKQGWFISLLGVIALSAIIFFVLPLLFGDYEKLNLIIYISIAIIFSIWAIVYLVKYLKARKKNKELLENIAEEEPEIDPVQLQVDDELGVLQGRLGEALTELQGSKFKTHNGDSKYLYQLPWYVIIGPPGSGKTTLLKNSNLDSPLSEKFGREAISGVGGTRNCDWWFAEEAVLLDTAGRYTTQDSNKEVDQKAWLGFLSMLKKNRPRRPINGIIIAISLDELLTSQRLLKHAKEIRKRLQELYEQFNLTLPVYLTITKSDLLSGFSEFFYDLEQDERNQVWGITFTEDNKALSTPLPLVEAELNELEEQLHKKVVYKLEKEIDLERRKKIYAFPQQFGSIKKTVNSFVDEIFSSSRYQHEILLRGIYFTSAEQTGTPIDKLLSTLSHVFGFEQKPSTPFQSVGKSYFINNLLNKVIFQEADLVGVDEKHENRKRWFQRSALATALLTTLVGAGLWFTSYTKNNSYTDIVFKNTETLKDTLESSRDKDDLVTATAILNRARNLATPQPEFLATLGLDQKERLISEADNTYHDLLTSRLLPQVVKVLEEELLNNKASTANLFQSLKSYLILSANHDEHFSANKELIKEIVKKAWYRDYATSLSPEQLSALGQHMNVLLETRPTQLSQPLDKALISQTRAILERSKLSGLIYNQVKSQLLSDSKLPSFVLAGSRGVVPNARSVFQRKSGTPLEEGIPGFYTYNGYREFRKVSGELVESFLADNWVLGNELAKVNLVDTQLEVVGLYLEEYQDEWNNLLQDIKIKSPSSLKHAAEITNILADPVQSPITRLLDEVVKQTYLSKPLEDASSPGGAVGGKVAKQTAKQLGYIAAANTGRIGQILESSISTDDLESLAKSKTGKSFDIVSAQFYKIRRLRSEEGEQTFSDAIKRLDGLSTSLRMLTGTLADEMRNEQQRTVANDLETLKTIALRQPAPLGAWLLEVRAEIASLLSGNVKGILNTQWKTNISSFCQGKLQGRYPLQHNSPKDIAIDDFSEFFGPNGRIEVFFKQNLASSIDRTGAIWRWRGTGPSPISDETLSQFQRADRIKKAFFPRGSQIPIISFTIKPIKISDNLSRVTLDVDGTSLVYENGRAKPVAMKWPGPKHAGYVSLESDNADTGASSSGSKEGPWAIYQMFTRKGRLIKKDDHTYRLIFKEGLNYMEFQVSTTSSDNSFNMLSDLTKFRCPTDLSQ